jgi:hypothetical protein
MSNDHYVPQFYLRNFSPDVRRDDSEPKRIHLINIPRRQFIPNASIKNECKKAGFHGYQIGVEAALSQLEGSAASVIKNMFESGTPPAPQSHNHQVLAGFIAIQRSRTLYAAESADKNADRMFKVAYATDPRLSGINLEAV